MSSSDFCRLLHAYVTHTYIQVHIQKQNKKIQKRKKKNKLKAQCSPFPKSEAGDYHALNSGGPTGVTWVLRVWDKEDCDLQ